MSACICLKFWCSSTLDTWKIHKFAARARSMLENSCSSSLNAHKFDVSVITNWCVPQCKILILPFTKIMRNVDIQKWTNHRIMSERLNIRSVWLSQQPLIWLRGIIKQKMMIMCSHGQAASINKFFQLLQLAKELIQNWIYS